MVVMTVVLGMAAALLAGCGSTPAGTQAAGTRTADPRTADPRTADPRTADPRTTQPPTPVPGAPTDPRSSRPEPTQPAGAGSEGVPTTPADPQATGPGVDPHASPEATGSGAGPGSGSTGPQASDPPVTGPRYQTPVFVGEPCSPELDSVPRQAINGLVLNCAPTPSGQARWSVPTQPPPPSAPAPGSECATADNGRVVQGSSGRPITCLRDQDGVFRWSEIS